MEKADLFLNFNLQHRGCIPASHPAAPGLILGIPKNFTLDVAFIY